jgi:hypothetical protein
MMPATNRDSRMRIVKRIVLLPELLMTDLKRLATPPTRGMA